MSGQLTDIDVVEVQKVNGFLVISGMSNDSDPSHVNCSNRGVRIFVNKFVTHTHPQGGWRVCIPCSFAEYDKDKGYKFEILAEDLNCAITQQLDKK